ncbi:MAG: NADH-quinone oxidoreductase subunit C [Verrucomicrobia bacterium]|nr:NADH-quinone oxidoreductase subunit C [Verrucomicrobiota bacterium]
MRTADDATKIEAVFSPDILEKKEFRGETTLSLHATRLHEVAIFCRDALGYDMLLDICSVDHYGSHPRFEVIYELYSIAGKSHLRLKCTTSEDEAEVDTVCDIWPTANWHEREVWDMMGVKFRNHPDLRRILMWEGYPYHPLRKEFPLEGIPTDVPDVAFTEVAPLAGGPFVTIPTEGNTEVREPRARHAGEIPTTATFIAEP